MTSVRRTAGEPSGNSDCAITRRSRIICTDRVTSSGRSKATGLYRTRRSSRNRNRPRATFRDPSRPCFVALCVSSHRRTQGCKSLSNPTSAAKAAMSIPSDQTSTSALPRYRMPAFQLGHIVLLRAREAIPVEFVVDENRLLMVFERSGRRHGIQERAQCRENDRVARIRTTAPRTIDDLSQPSDQTDIASAVRHVPPPCLAERQVRISAWTQSLHLPPPRSMTGRGMSGYRRW